MKHPRSLSLGVSAAGIAALVCLATMRTLNAGEQIVGTRVRAQQHDRIRIHQRREEGQLDSYNWSGYAVTIPNGLSATTDVKGSWVVPSVNCTVAPKGYSSQWVGIDGFSSNTVEQVGTDSDCVSLNGRTTGTPTYYAWFEFYPGYLYEILFSRGVRAGDTITAEVKYVGEVNAGRRGSGSEFTVTITDVTQNESYSTTSVVQGSAQSSAEWIEEAPATNSKLLPLADFGQVSFSSATATVSSLKRGRQTQVATGGIGSFGANVEELTIVAECAPHAIKAQPSALNGQGNGFSVAWLSPGP